MRAEVRPEEKAAIIRDASARVRDQAILARDQANVIGTFSEPLGLEVAGLINVIAGPTDSFLQVVGATAVDLIQTTIGKYSIYAPFDGVVIARDTDVAAALQVIASGSPAELASQSGQRQLRN